MAESGFIYKDMLLCCKFAEGDSRILLQKIARDELKRVQRAGLPNLLYRMATETNPYELARAKQAFTLVRKLRAAPSLGQGFEKEWEAVYALAETVCDCHYHNERPNSREIGRMLSTYPYLMERTRDPLLVSRL